MTRSLIAAALLLLAGTAHAQFTPLPGPWSNWKICKRNDPTRFCAEDANEIVSAIDSTRSYVLEQDAQIRATHAADVTALESLLNGIVSSNLVVLPREWTHAGDGFSTTFPLPSADLSSSSSYMVVIDGVVQASADFTVSAQADTITFTEAPPPGAQVFVRCLTYARAQDTGCVAEAAVVNVKCPPYDARGDGASDDTGAIRAAIAVAKAGRKSVYLPAGTYIVSDNFPLDSSHNGMTIFGDGPSSVVKLANVLNGANVVAGWLFHVYDATTPVENLTIRDLRLDGSRATILWGTTSHGIIFAHEGLIGAGVSVSRVTAHGFRTQGFHLNAGPVRLSDVFAYDNGMHGIGLNAGGEEHEITNATVTGNLGYGVDMSTGRAVIRGLVSRGNTLGGVKYSEGAEYLSLTDALIEDNLSSGFSNTGVAANMELYVDNIVTRNNSGYGFRVASAKRVVAGSIVSVGDNTGYPANGTSATVYFTGVPSVRVDSLTVISPPNIGVALTGAVKSYSFGYVEVRDAQLAGLVLSNTSGAAPIGSIASCVFRNTNKSGATGATAAALQVLIPSTIKVSNCLLEDDQGSPTQTTGMYFAGGAQAAIASSHFGTGIVSGQQVMSANTGTRVSFGDGNTGITTRARGTFTGDGGASTYTITLPTALESFAGGVRSAQVTPASSHASGAHWISAQTADSITVTYASATPAGTGNVSLRYDVQMEIQR